jgi:hypothetical protein
MKKTLLTFAVVACAASLFAQGTVNFNNRNTTLNLFAPVYAPETGGHPNDYVSKTGQSAVGLPSGVQTYSGALLTGSNFRAQLFSANGADQVEGSLVGSVSSLTTFRTGTSSGGFAGVTATLANVPKDAPVATLQVRAWDNTSGLYPDWAAAETAWLAGTIAAGKSASFNLNAIGGDFNSPPLPNGLSSFNIYFIPVPEPSTFVLAGLGAAGLLIFRRRK